MKGIQAAIVAIVVVVVAAVAVVSLRGSSYGQGTGDNQQQGGNQVSIQDLAFNPSTITVSAGTTITWTNNDGVEHTVTSTDGPAPFDCPSLMSGGTVQFTFDTPGTYTYRCNIHPTMTGTIVVT